MIEGIIANIRDAEARADEIAREAGKKAKEVLNTANAKAEQLIEEAKVAADAEIASAKKKAEKDAEKSRTKIIEKTLSDEAAEAKDISERSKAASQLLIQALTEKYGAR